MRIRITPALVISVIALFIALGGVANATVDLPWNSVGKEQLKWGAVDSSKVENRSLKAIDFAQGQLPQGKQGPKGDTGEKGETGARGPAGAAASGATDSGTGHTLKDAAGTSLGEIFAVPSVHGPVFVVLWDGGFYAYNAEGLDIYDEVSYPDDGCSGQPFVSVGYSMLSPQTIAGWQGHRRLLTGVLGSPRTLAAFKATSTSAHVTQAYYKIDYDTGVCSGPFQTAPVWGIQLEQVPAPPSPVQQPLTIN